jgi:alkanesulfonate monooxygenase SsuD/methylene tetrahydromethanopterin reductase-like flavin-dependent oxidoreductase (luciferase family)
MIPISILDLSFTTTATPASRALVQTIQLAQAVDSLGYTRFWVSEHHNLPSVAGPAP